jgi:REP element-mobilizing transposase RayT
MSKKPRPQYEDAIYHVTCRGNARQTIHLTDMDRELLVSLIGGAVKRCDWQLCAYCLMNNHYNLLVRTPEANIAKGMHYINMMYARIFNQRHELSGHLFERRTSRCWWNRRSTWWSCSATSPSTRCAAGCAFVPKHGAGRAIPRCWAKFRCRGFSTPVRSELSSARGRR